MAKNKNDLCVQSKSVSLFSCCTVCLIAFAFYADCSFLSAVCSRCVAVSAVSRHANVALIFSAVRVLD